MKGRTMPQPRTSAALSLSLLAGIASLASPCFAQSECPNYGGTVTALPPGGTWITDPTWIPNRLPGVMLSLWNANWCINNTEGNPRGLAPWWCDSADNPEDPSLCVGSDGVANLLAQLDEFYDTHGFRRFMLYLPAGTVINHEYVSSSQWLTMPAAKRQQIIAQLGDWILTKGDVQIEIYGTFHNAMPQTLCMEPSPGGFVTSPDCPPVPPGEVNAHALACPTEIYAGYPSPYSVVDLCVLRETIQPWRDLGVGRFWLDSASLITIVNGQPYELFDDFIEIAHSPPYRGVLEQGGPHFLGAEAYPQILNSVSLNMPQVLLAPAIWFPLYIESLLAWTNWNLDGDTNNNSVNDRLETELVAILDWSLDYTRPDNALELLGWARRGFVMFAANLQPYTTQSIRLLECMKRVYDFGTLNNRRDFNGDGSITQQDLADDDFMWNQYRGTGSGANWIHGDVDGDDDVDISDRMKYQTWYFNMTGLWNTPINLNNAEPLDIFTMPPP
jgi:hypothetical protein